MKHVVITGGTGGLGRAIAETFGQAGWAVAAPGRRDLDLRDEQAISRYFQDRPVDLLVCAAGVIRDAPLLHLSPEAWDDTVTVNFTAARRCANAVVAGMKARGEGHLLFISSRSAVHPPAGQAAYAVSKAALLGLTIDLARCHGADNIRANVILPGFLETPMTASLSDKRRAEILDDHQLQRFNTPSAVASFVFHLHQHLPHTSGQIFQLDSRA